MQLNLHMSFFFCNFALAKFENELLVSDILAVLQTQSEGCHARHAHAVWRGNGRFGGLNHGRAHIMKIHIEDHFILLGN